MEAAIAKRKTKQKDPQARKRFWKKIKKYWTLYLFLLPAVIWFALFCYVPMAGGVTIIFKDFSFSKGIWGSNFTYPLIKNLELFFNMPTLWKMIGNTFLIAGLKLLLFPAPIILALMLNSVKNKAVKKIIQTVTYFPFFLSWVVVTSMLEELLSPYGAGGPLYNALQLLTGNSETVYYMIDKPYFIPVVLLTYLWKTIGWNSIVYLAAISNINPDLYEAASIDGANKLQMTWHITLSEIKPVVGLTFIMSLGSILSAGFEQIYFLQSPSNYDLSNVLDVFVVTFGIEKGNYAIAGIAGLVQGLVGLCFILLGNTVLKKTSDISLW